MPRLFALALATLAALFGVSNGALAQERFALVIGNSQYRAITPLPNPVRDATAISAFLRSAGFDVTAATDLDQASMRRTVRDFTAKLADKGEDAVVLLAFFGHGVQVDGVNYLLPIDAKVAQESDVALEGVRFADIMNMLNGLRSKSRIVILDACRNNPFGESKGATGLAIVNAPAGSLVAYSTSPGAVAADGAGSNSPFTTALLTAGKTPGAPIEATLKTVRLAVHKVTGGRQVPWEVSSLVKPFSFFPGASTATDEPAGEKSAAAWREELKNYSPQEAFDVVVRENRVVVYKEYIALFPQSPFIGQLRGLLDRRLEMWAWFDAVTRGQAAAFEAFLKRYPASDLSRGAKRLLNQAQQNAALAGNAPGSLDLSRGLAQQIVYKDVVKFRDVIKEIPVEKLVYRDVIKFRDVVKEVPVEKIVYKDRIREIKVPVEKVVYVPKVEYKDRVIYKDRIVYKDRVIYKDKIVRVTTPCRCSAPSFNPNGGFNRPIRRHRSR